jgi:hypothetical protein
METVLTKSFQLNNPPCISEVIDNDAVIINLDNGHYYHLDKTSGLIWDLLCQGYSPLNILQCLDLKKETESLETIISTFITALLDEELLTFASASANTLNTPIKIEGDFSLSFERYKDMKELLALDPIHESDEKIGWPKAKVCEVEG